MKINIGNTDLNADWIKTLPGHQDEIAIHEQLSREIRDSVISNVKGGKGSGHRGHRGRPGHRGGSVPGSNIGPFPSERIEFQGALNRAVDVAHRTAKLAGREEVSVISKDGNVLYTGLGGEGPSAGTPGSGYGVTESPELTDALDQGDTVVHGHPLEVSFSDSDVRSFLIHPNLERTIVVTGNGTVYILSKTERTSESQYLAGRTVRDRAMEIVHRGGPYGSDKAEWMARREAYDTAMEDMARDTGLQYDVRKIDDFSGLQYAGGRWWGKEGEMISNVPPAAKSFSKPFSLLTRAADTVTSKVKSLSLALKQSAGAIRYRKNIAGLAQNLWNGTISGSEFLSVMKSQIIPLGFEQAWLDGSAAEGITEYDDLNKDEKQRLRERISAEKTYVRGFRDYIVEHSKAEGFHLVSLEPRIDLWANRYTEVMNEAKVMAGGDRKYRWVLHARESCRSCLRLAGQVRRMSFWQEHDCWPQHHDLECMTDAGGPTVCQCEFEETDEPCSHGPLPHWRA